MGGGILHLLGRKITALSRKTGLATLTAGIPLTFEKSRGFIDGTPKKSALK